MAAASPRGQASGAAMTWGSQSLARTATIIILAVWCAAATPQRLLVSAPDHVTTVDKSKRDSDSLSEIVIEHIDDDGQAAAFLVGLLILGVILIGALLLLGCLLLLRMSEPRSAEYHRVSTEDPESHNEKDASPEQSQQFTYVDLTKSSRASRECSGQGLHTRAPRFSVQFVTTETDASETCLRREQRVSPTPAPRSSRLAEMGRAAGEVNSAPPLRRSHSEVSYADPAEAVSTSKEHETEPQRKRIRTERVSGVSGFRDESLEDGDGPITCQECCQHLRSPPRLEVNIQDRFINAGQHDRRMFQRQSPIREAAVEAESAGPATKAERSENFAYKNNSALSEAPSDGYSIYEMSPGGISTSPYSQSQSTSSPSFSPPEPMFTASQPASRSEQEDVSVYGHGRYYKEQTGGKENREGYNRRRDSSPGFDSTWQELAMGESMKKQTVPVSAVVEAPDTKVEARDGGSVSASSFRDIHKQFEEEAARARQTAASPRKPAGSTRSSVTPTRNDANVEVRASLSARETIDARPLTRPGELSVQVPEMIAYFDRMHKGLESKTNSESSYKSGVTSASGTGRLELPLPPIERTKREILRKLSGEESAPKSGIPSQRSRQDTQDSTKSSSEQEFRQQPTSPMERSSGTGVSADRIEERTEAAPPSSVPPFGSTLVLPDGEHPRDITSAVVEKRSQFLLPHPPQAELLPATAPESKELVKNTGQASHEVQRVPSPDKHDVEARFVTGPSLTEESGYLVSPSNSRKSQAGSGTLVSAIVSPQSRTHSSPDSDSSPDELPFSSSVHTGETQIATDTSGLIVTKEDKPIQRTDMHNEISVDVAESQIAARSADGETRDGKSMKVSFMPDQQISPKPTVASVAVKPDEDRGSLTAEERAITETAKERKTETHENQKSVAEVARTSASNISARPSSQDGMIHRREENEDPSSGRPQPTGETGEKQVSHEHQFSSFGKSTSPAMTVEVSGPVVVEEVATSRGLNLRNETDGVLAAKHEREVPGEPTAGKLTAGHEAPEKRISDGSVFPKQLEPRFNHRRNIEDSSLAEGQERNLKSIVSPDSRAVSTESQSRPPIATGSFHSAEESTHPWNNTVAGTSSATTFLTETISTDDSDKSGRRLTTHEQFQIESVNEAGAAIHDIVDAGKNLPSLLVHDKTSVVPGPTHPAPSSMPEGQRMSIKEAQHSPKPENLPQERTQMNLTVEAKTSENVSVIPTLDKRAYLSDRLQSRSGENGAPDNLNLLESTNLRSTQLQSQQNEPEIVKKEDSMTMATLPREKTIGPYEQPEGTLIETTIQDLSPGVSLKEKRMSSFEALARRVPVNLQADHAALVPIWTNRSLSGGGTELPDQMKQSAVQTAADFSLPATREPDSSHVAPLNDSASASGPLVSLESSGRRALAPRTHHKLPVEVSAHKKRLEPAGHSSGKLIVTRPALHPHVEIMEGNKSVEPAASPKNTAVSSRLPPKWLPIERKNQELSPAAEFQGNVTSLPSNMAAPLASQPVDVVQQNVPAPPANLSTHTLVPQHPSYVEARSSAGYIDQVGSSVVQAVADSTEHATKESILDVTGTDDRVAGGGPLLSLGSPSEKMTAPRTAHKPPVEVTESNKYVEPAVSTKGTELDIGWRPKWPVAKGANEEMLMAAKVEGQATSPYDHSVAPSVSQPPIDISTGRKDLAVSTPYSSTLAARPPNYPQTKGSAENVAELKPSAVYATTDSAYPVARGRDSFDAAAANDTATTIGPLLSLGSPSRQIIASRSPHKFPVEDTRDKNYLQTAASPRSRTINLGTPYGPPVEVMDSNSAEPEALPSHGVMVLRTEHEHPIEITEDNRSIQLAASPSRRVVVPRTEHKHPIEITERNKSIQPAASPNRTVVAPRAEHMHPTEVTEDNKSIEPLASPSGTVVAPRTEHPAEVMEDNRSMEPANRSSREVSLMSPRTLQKHPIEVMEDRKYVEPTGSPARIITAPRTTPELPTEIIKGTTFLEPAASPKHRAVDATRQQKFPHQETTNQEMSSAAGFQGQGQLTSPPDYSAVTSTSQPPSHGSAYKTDPLAPPAHQAAFVTSQPKFEGQATTFRKHDVAAPLASEPPGSFDYGTQKPTVTPAFNATVMPSSLDSSLHNGPSNGTVAETPSTLRAPPSRGGELVLVGAPSDSSQVGGVFAASDMSEEQMPLTPNDDVAPPLSQPQANLGNVQRDSTASASRKETSTLLADISPPPVPTGGEFVGSTGFIESSTITPSGMSEEQLTNSPNYDGSPLVLEPPDKLASSQQKSAPRRAQMGSLMLSALDPGQDEGAIGNVGKPHTPTAQTTGASPTPSGMSEGQLPHSPKYDRSPLVPGSPVKRASGQRESARRRAHMGALVLSDRDPYRDEGATGNVGKLTPPTVQTTGAFPMPSGVPEKHVLSPAEYVGAAPVSEPPVKLASGRKELSPTSASITTATLPAIDSSHDQGAIDLIDKPKTHAVQAAGTLPRLDTSHEEVVRINDHSTVPPGGMPEERAPSLADRTVATPASEPPVNLGSGQRDAAPPSVRKTTAMLSSLGSFRNEGAVDPTSTFTTVESTDTVQPTRTLPTFGTSGQEIVAIGSVIDSSKVGGMFTHPEKSERSVPGTPPQEAHSTSMDEENRSGRASEAGQTAVSPDVFFGKNSPVLARGSKDLITFNQTGNVPVDNPEEEQDDPDNPSTRTPAPSQDGAKKSTK